MSEQAIIPINYIERKPDSNKYRVVGKGVTVEFLSCFIGDEKWPVSRICENYGLTPAEVYAAWAFYYDHQEEIDQRLAQEESSTTAHADEDKTRREVILRRYEERTGHPYSEP